MTQSKDDHGQANAKAWYESIAEMVAALQKTASGDPMLSDDAAYEDAERAIHESVLSVEIRSGWYMPGTQDKFDINKGNEYRILLTYGGPSLQLTGSLDEHGEPETARLEYQDWGTPWTVFNISAYRPELHDSNQHSLDDFLAATDEFEANLMAFARCFYFRD